MRTEGLREARRVPREGTALLVLLLLAASVAFGTGSLDAGVGPFSDWCFSIVWSWSFLWPDRSTGPVSIPLWNPYVLSGYPYLSDPQMSPFYPAWWLLLPLPLERLARPFAFLHILMAAWGAFRYARLDLSVRSALLAALVYGFGGVLVPHLYGGHVGMAPAIALFPWALLGARKIAGGERRSGIFLFASATLLGLLAGHVSTMLYFVAAAAVVAIFAAGSGQRRRAATGVVLSIGLAAAGAGVSLLPFLFEIIRQNPRGGVAGYDFATSFSWEPSYWGTFLFPFHGGDPPGRVFPRGIPHTWAEMTCFVGLIPLLLAAYALFRPQNGEVRRALIFVLLGVVLAMGRHTPVLGGILWLLPPLGQIRNASRFLFLAAWGLAILAAHGLEIFAASRRPAARRALSLGLIAGAALPLVFFSGRIFSDAAPVPRLEPVPVGDPHARVLLPFSRANAATALRLRSPDGGYTMIGSAYRARAAGHAEVNPDGVFFFPSDTPTLQHLGVRWVSPFAPTPPPDFFPSPSDSSLWEFRGAISRARLLDASGRPAGRVEWAEDGTDRVVLDVDGPGGTLRLADAWHPDWRARLNGTPVPILRCDGAFRCVEVPPGDHRVEFSFVPLPLLTGAFLTWGASLFLSLLGVTVLRGERQREVSSN